jgi:hypothetical protein
MPFRNDDAANLDAREYPEPDGQSNGRDDTVPCPSCKGLIYEEAERCPHCGWYITEEETSSRRPLWITIGILLCLGIALLWAIWG